MPLIKKPQKAVKVKSQAKPKKTTQKFKLPTASLALTKAKTKNTSAYYDCCAKQTQAGLKGVKITQICHDCKHQALAINAKMKAAKNQAAKKIQEGYKKLGQGLSELIANYK